MKVDLNTLAKGSYLVQIEYNGQPSYLERINGGLEAYLINQSKITDPEALFSVSSQVDHVIGQLRKAAKSLRIDTHSHLIN